MLCDICNKNPATVHLTEIVSGKITEIHICEICAKKKTEEFQKQFSIADFLSELVDIDSKGEAVLPVLVCSKCGLTYQEFKKIGRLGCGQCYEDFKKQLLPLFRRIHGSVRHRGKIPKIIARQGLPLIERAKELRSQLERAIKLEEYEEAARVRDEIRELQVRIKKDSTSVNDKKKSSRDKPTEDN